MGGWVSNKNKKKRIATSSSPLFPSYRFASSFCLQHRSPWLVLLLLLCSRRRRLILLQLHHRTALHCGLIVQHVLYGISLFHCFRRPLGSRSSCLQDWRDKKVHSTNWRKKVMPILYFSWWSICCGNPIHQPIPSVILFLQSDRRPKGNGFFF